MTELKSYHPLPAWVQGIRERADKATKGPWMLTSSILGGSLVVLANDEETGILFPSKVVAHIPGGKRATDTGLFIEAVIQDVPQLLDLVEEMGAAIGDAAEVLQECVEGETALIERLWRIWAKYRGEAEGDDC